MQVDYSKFLEFIKEVYPEMYFSETDGVCFLSIDGFDGPIVSDDGIEVDDSSDFDIADRIEQESTELLENDEIDFSSEAKALKEIAEMIRRKQKELSKVEIIKKVLTPCGIAVSLIPWKEEYLDEINDIVFDLFTSLIKCEEDGDTRLSFKGWLEMREK